MQPLAIENPKPAPDSGARFRLAPRVIRRIPDLDAFLLEQPAEIRRRQLAGQKVAEIHVGAATTVHDEPVVLPARRAPFAPIAIALAAAFAIFGVTLGARGHARAPRVEVKAIETVSTPIVYRPTTKSR